MSKIIIIECLTNHNYSYKDSREKDKYKITNINSKISNNQNMIMSSTMRI